MVASFLILKGMTGALAPFSYLVMYMRQNKVSKTSAREPLLKGKAQNS